MSRASKIFLGSSILISGFTVWGVHFLQQRESDSMYQGVLKDEQRLKDKALAAASAAASGIASAVLPSPSPSAAGGGSGSGLGSGSSATPLNTPSSPARAPGIPDRPAPVPQVQQPAAVMDEDCETCRISPPAQLLEAQSKDERRAERHARELEYRQQRELAGRLGREQGFGQGGGRLV